MGRKISEEFKRQTVLKHLTSDKTIEATAAELGVSRSALGRWVNDSRYREGPTPEAVEEMDLAAQVGLLKRELKLVKMERDYLRRGLDFIAQETGIQK
jgi:transposase-like protein